MTPGYDVLDLCAGPGGWDLPAVELGLTPLGIELDPATCATRAAAGLETVQASIADLDPRAFAPPRLFIASPPCPTFSSAGLGSGRAELELLQAAIAELERGGDWRAIVARCDDARSALVVEPLRWALELEPELIALEQVPAVLPLWEAIARALEARGWSTWTGIIRAEEHGVPQTRERAILLASRTGQARPPAPTHQRHTTARTGQADLLLPPPVSMADAVPDWSPDDLVGFPRRNDRPGGADYRERDRRPASAPAFALTEKARSWTRLALRGNAQRNATVRRMAEPAPTIKGGKDYRDRGWIVEANGERALAPLTEAEALALQTFPRDYPLQGSRTRRFLQIGNAVPPTLARALLATLVTT
jgi:DNA (cytosine-5)-methyltransferase 1